MAAKGQGRYSRIAEVYAAIVPQLDQSFARQLQKLIEQAINGTNFGSLSRQMRTEGGQAGAAFKNSFEAAARGLEARESFADERQEAAQGGRRAGDAFQRSAQQAAGDTNLMQGQSSPIPQASTIGQQAGNAFGGAFQVAANTNNSIISQLQSTVSQAGQAGQQAGQNFNQGFQSTPLTARPPSTTGFQAAGSRAGNAFQGAFERIVGAAGGAGIGTALFGGARSALAQDENIKNLAAAVGANDEQTETLKAAYKDLTTRGFGADETTAILRSLATADRTLMNNREDLMAVSLELASVSRSVSEDHAMIAQVARQSVDSGLVKSTQEAIRMLTAGAQMLPTELRSELFEQISEYQNQGSAAGLTLGEQITFAIGNSKLNSQYGMDYGNDALKELQNLVLDTENTDAAEALRKIGEDPDDIRKALIAGGPEARDALNRIAQGLREVKDPAERATLALKLFGTPLEELRRSGTGIDDFLENIWTLNDQLGDTKAKMGDVVSTVDSSFSMTLAETFGIVAQNIIEMLIPALEWLQPHLEAFNAWAKENPTLMKWIIGAVIVLATVLTSVLVAGALGSLFTAGVGVFTTIAGGIAAVAGGIGALAPIFAGFGGIVTTVITAIGGVLAAVGIGNIAIAGLAAAGVALVAGAGVLIANLWKDYDGTLAYMRENLGFFGNYLADSIEGWGMLFYSIFEGVTGGFSDMIENWKELWNNLVKWFTESEFFLLPAIEWVNKQQGKPKLTSNSFSGGSVPMMATGGDVMGPTLLIAGEKDPETIVNRGKMNRTLDLVSEQLLNGGGNGGGITNYITVNPAPGMNEDALVDKMINKMAKQNKRTR